MERTRIERHPNRWIDKVRVAVRSYKTFWRKKARWECIVEKYFVHWTHFFTKKGFRTKEEAESWGTNYLDTLWDDYKDREYIKE